MKVNLLTPHGDRSYGIHHINNYGKPPDVVIWGSKAFVRWNKDEKHNEYRESSVVVIDPKDEKLGPKPLPGQESLISE